MTQKKQGERWREQKFCRSLDAQKFQKSVKSQFLAADRHHFFPPGEVRGSGPPRREAAAYGVAYLSTKRLGAVKSLSGRAAMFVPAKTFFCQESRDQPTFAS